MQKPAAAPDAVQEIIDLWTRLHGEPPPILAPVSMMVQALVEGLRAPGGCKTGDVA